VQAELGDGFLCRVEFSLLLVIVENPRRRPDILGIRVYSGARLVQKLAQAVCLPEQREVPGDQFRRP